MAGLICENWFICLSYIASKPLLTEILVARMTSGEVLELARYKSRPLNPSWTFFLSS